MSSTRVILADDHPMMRAGVRSLLDAIEGVEVIAQASDGTEALALCGLYKPDILLIDISMPGLSGLDVTARITHEHPEIKVLILSMHGDDEYIRRAIHSGARGYLLKDAEESELSLAIRVVARGEMYLCSRASNRIVADYLRQSVSENVAAGELTPRQREVLYLIATGKPTKAIARELGIAVKTVETHRTQLMERLNIHDIAGLVRYAIRIGLISSE
jgi:DNA-binding NarL/FixJ family response regulator